MKLTKKEKSAFLLLMAAYESEIVINGQSFKDGVDEVLKVVGVDKERRMEIFRARVAVKKIISES